MSASKDDTGGDDLSVALMVFLLGLRVESPYLNTFRLLPSVFLLLGSVRPSLPSHCFQGDLVQMSHEQCLFLS